MSDQNSISIKKSLIVPLVALMAVVGGCTPEIQEGQKTSQKTVQKAVRAPERISLPSGAGVLLKDKKVVLIPNNTENKDMYEKRLKDMNAYVKETGYELVTIIDPENKAAYDAAMTTLYPRMYGKMYNMLDNPISSWASLQIGGAEFATKYTPGDILKVMREVKENYKTSYRTL